MDRSIPAVSALQYGPVKGEPTLAARELVLVPGKGIEGDRFFKKVGVHTGKLAEGREITLIEEEALDGARREHGLELSFAECRRNVLVRGVRLNDLVGRDFAVGEAVLRGVRLCEPCRHLADMTKKPVVKPLAHRGGLNAVIVRGGTIRTGDAVVVS